MEAELKFGSILFLVCIIKSLLGRFVQQVHELHRPCLQHKHYLIYLSDQYAIKEISNNSDNQASDGGNHCFVYTA